MLDTYGQKNYIEHPLIWPNTVEYRLYQKNIANVASEKNTLVILPTALGKTVISALVTANVLYNYQGLKVLVMAPTRPLIMQHRTSFTKVLKLRDKDTVLLTGKTPPNSRRAIWDRETKVIFSTPQVVRNDLVTRRLVLENYGLLIFDECHRAVKEYAYTHVAKSYISQAKYPLILGMTASPGSNLSRVLEVCRNLYIERVEHRSEEDLDVKPYIQSVTTEWMRVDLPAEYLKMKSLIRTMLDKRLNWLRSIGLIQSKPEYTTRRKLIEAGDELRSMLEESTNAERGKIFWAIINQSLGLTLFHMLELLETQGLWPLKAFLNKVDLAKREKKSYTILVNETEYKSLRSWADNSTMLHPKLRLLKQIVSEHLDNNASSRMLVFTQYRDTASHLVAELNTIKLVRAERFVGQASKNMDKGLTQEEQAERIKRLKDGLTNILVATSIAEEGLDIPAVDQVIFYEPIPSEIRYIQRRGRTGRKAPGKVTILTTNNSLDMIYLYASKKRTEKMKKIAKNLSSKLQPMFRTHEKPRPKPLTLTELKTLEKEAKQVTDEPENITTESANLKVINKTIERISRRIYMKLLARGPKGANLEQIRADITYDEPSTAILKSAISKLIKNELVTEIGVEKFVISSAVKASAHARGKIFKITVEKIYHGQAVVRINDKWRARLLSQEYNGPRNLIKKNSTFTAIGELYKTNGTLCLRVNEVTQIIS